MNGTTQAVEMVEVASGEFLPNGTGVIVWSWSGNVRPYSGRAYLNGKFVGKSGFCRTHGAAAHAASTLLSKAQAAKS